MTENKTTATPEDPAAFIEAVPDAERRGDAAELCRLMEQASGEPPKMWGKSIIGFGRYRYRYESGREGESMRIGFSPRAKEFVLYVTDGFPRYESLLGRLGKHRTGKACLYIKRLADVDQGVLEELLAASLAYADEKYPRGE